MFRLFILLLGGFLVTGCTTYLMSEHVPPGAKPSSPGFSYYLPRQSFQITATYELKSCPNANGKTSEEINAPLVISQAVTVTELISADSEQHFSIPLDTLTSGWKTTSLTTTLHPNQTLKSVGVTVEDKTAQVLKGLVGTAVTVAKISAGVFTAAATPKSLCRDEIYSSLGEIKRARASLKDPKLDEKARAIQAAIISSAQESLKITSRFYFDPSAKKLEERFAFDKDAFLNWFSDLAQVSAGGGASRYTQAVTTGAKIIGYTPDVKNDDKAGSEAKGVVYRDPAPVRLVVCAGGCSSVSNKVIFESDTQLPQLGRYAVLSLKNGPFAKNNLAVVFSENGAISSATYGEESKVDKVTTALSDAAKSVQEFKGQKVATDQAEAKEKAGAPLNSIKAETEILKAKAAQIEAQQKLNELMLP